MIFAIVGMFIIGFFCGSAFANKAREWREDRRFFKWLDEQEEESRRFFDQTKQQK